MILAAAMPLYAAMLAAGAEPASLVRPMMGTGAAGCVVPVAAAPFGMVQLGPDTYFTSSGYHYDHDVIYGFSHTHKSGGGGTDFQDIMFFPVADSAWQRLEVYPDRVGSRFSHEREHVEPGYYRVRLLDSDIEAELTATSRCGMHRYAYPDGAARQLIVDLKHGCQHSTTIFADEDFDTVKVSRLEWVDERTVRGFRISNGWAPEQHVYFYAEFSEPIRSCRFFDHGRSVEGIRELEGTDVRAVLNFGGRDGDRSWRVSGFLRSAWKGPGKICRPKSKAGTSTGCAPPPIVRGTSSCQPFGSRAGNRPAGKFSIPAFITLCSTLCSIPT